MAWLQPIYIAVPAPLSPTASVLQPPAVPIYTGTILMSLGTDVTENRPPVTTSHGFVL